MGHDYYLQIFLISPVTGSIKNALLATSPLEIDKPLPELELNTVSGVHFCTLSTLLKAGNLFGGIRLSAAVILFHVF